MTDIEQFNSDMDKLISRAGAPNAATSASYTPGAIAREMSRLFQVFTRNSGNLGKALSDYWTERYGPTLTSIEGYKHAAEWLINASSLLTGYFEPDMDFPDEDWSTIREIISEEADNMDMNLLTEILTIIVDRGKA